MVVQLIKYGLLHRFLTCRSEGVDEERFPPFQLWQEIFREREINCMIVIFLEVPGTTQIFYHVTFTYLSFHKQSLLAIACKNFPFKVTKKGRFSEQMAQLP